MNRIHTDTPVVVFTVSSAFHLHGMMGVIRSLGRLGIPVYAVHPHRRVPADRSRFGAGRFLAVLDEAAPERLLSDLLEIGRKVSRESILMPIDDVATLFVDDHATALRERFLFPDRPLELARALSNKEELGRLCKRLDVPTPKAAVPRSRHEVVAFAEQVGYPIVVKVIDPLLLHQRVMTASVAIMEDSARLLETYDRMEATGDPNILLQEYIPGGPDSIWMFNGYFSERSECLVGFAGTKLRQYPPYSGPACLAVCRANAMVEATAKDFLAAVGYRGIVDLDYRYDSRDGEYKLLDVNPRIGATFRLFVAANGMDVARALYLDLTGQSVPASMPRDGRKWIVEHHDLLASWQYHRDRQFSVKDWIWSLCGVRETAWFAWDDPVPFAALCRRSALLAFQRATVRCAKR